jgi:hypothetical protein
MKDAQKIAEIAQSAYIWDLFVSSGLLARARLGNVTLEEAQNSLQTALQQRPEGHSERERMLSACARLEAAQTMLGSLEVIGFEA